MEKVDKEDHVQLLSAADLDLSHSLLIDLVDVDDVEITQTVLSAIQNEKMLIVFEILMNYTAVSVHFGTTGSYFAEGTMGAIHCYTQ